MRPAARHAGRGRSGRIARALGGLALAAGGLGQASSAVAHPGTVEVLTRVMFDEERPESLVVRVDSRGGALLFSDDGGHTLRMLCGAIAAPNTLTLSIAVARVPGGATLVAGAEGLTTLDSAGCGAVREPLFDGQHVADLAVEQGRPERVYAVTDAPDADNVLAVLQPDGRFAELGAREHVQRTRVRVVPLPGGGHRIYETTLDGTYVRLTDQGTLEIPRCALRHSDDDGASWTSYPCPLTPGALTLEAVEPGNPDRLFVMAYRADSLGALFVSDDRGETFTQYMELYELGGMEFLEDGRVLIGDGGSVFVPGSGGLFVSTGWDTAPTKLAPYPVLCLARPPSGGEIFACQRFTLGTVDLDDGEFHVLSGLTELSDFVECPEHDSAPQCEAQLCRGYCAPGYFAEAPVCGAYHASATCGPCADDAEGDACLAARAASDAQPGERDAGDGGDAGDASRDARTDGAHASSGGCSVSRGGAAGSAWLVALLLSCVTRRPSVRPARRAGSPATAK